MLIRTFVFAISVMPLVSGCDGCPHVDHAPRLSAEAIHRIADRRAAEEGINVTALSPPVVSFDSEACTWWAWYSLKGLSYPEDQQFAVLVHDVTGSSNSVWARGVR